MNGNFVTVLDHVRAKEQEGGPKVGKLYDWGQLRAHCRNCHEIHKNKDDAAACRIAVAALRRK